MWRALYILLVFSLTAKSQLQFISQQTELGTIAEASEIKGDVLIKNNSDKKIYLMRADAEAGVKVYVSKKTLLQNDTCLMIISFAPAKNGKFNKQIKLIASDKATPYELSVSGNLLNFKPDNKQACFYFGSHKQNSGSSSTEIPVVIPVNNQPKDNSNKLPGSMPPAPVKEKPKTVKTNTTSEYFAKEEFKPNNLLFLVDVSSSMRDSLKLPLMKSVLHTLIDKVRDVDSITVISYASKVKVLNEAISGSDKKTLHTMVDSLKAKGMTSGNKAILTSQNIAQKHFITNGNNQIFLATDGEFKFAKEDYQKWKENQKHKKIIVSTIAFGNDKDALKNLKHIAELGEGSFIHINSKNGSTEKLLTEIKTRSKK